MLCVRACMCLCVCVHIIICMYLVARMCVCIRVCLCVRVYACMHVFKHHVLLIIYFLIISFTRPDPSGYHYRWLPVEICCYPSMN